MYMPASRSSARFANGSRAPYAGVLLAGYLAFVLLGTVFVDGGWINALLHDHAMAFVGLPLAAFAAQFVVGAIERARGPIHFEAMGMRFRGASATLVLGIVVFLTIVVALRLVWPLG